MRMSLSAVADEVARAISYAEGRGHSAYVTTAVSYPNGTAAVVRIDEGEDGYFVSDDGYGALCADLMGAMPSFNKVAPIAAHRWGVSFDHRSFFVLKVSRDQLPGAVVAIANTSVNAVERTIYALEAVKAKRNRQIFENRIHDAFGKRAEFDATVRGARREWRFDAIVKSEHGISAVFEFVSPSFNAVAAANMQIGDIKKLTDSPYAVATLADYEKTDASLRSILSTSADLVIAANDDIQRYQIATAA
jgi:hypothetical protein